MRKLQQEGKIGSIVDKELKGGFDKVEAEEMVQVALLCTQYHPSSRPKISDVLTMLEGDGLADKWEANHKLDPSPPPEQRPQTAGPPAGIPEFVDDSFTGAEAMELSGPR